MRGLVEGSGLKPDCGRLRVNLDNKAESPIFFKSGETCTYLNKDWGKRGWNEKILKAKERG